MLSGTLEYNSIALFPNSDFIDGGVGVVDAGSADARRFIDAAQLPDAGMSVDAGGGGGGGGGCASSNGGGCGLAFAVLFGVGLLLWRRRRHPRPHGI